MYGTNSRNKVVACLILDNIPSCTDPEEFGDHIYTRGEDNNLCVRVAPSKPVNHHNCGTAHTAHVKDDDIDGHGSKCLHNILKPLYGSNNVNAGIFA